MTVRGTALCTSTYFQSKEILMSFNKITIVGYLGRDPELRYTPQGTAVCKMSVATTERRKNAAGQTQDHTTWFRITVWGRQGELANEYLARGRQVYLEGRLRLEEYTDRDGNNRVSPEVTATDIQFLGRKDDAQNGGSSYGGGWPQENFVGGSMRQPERTGGSGQPSDNGHNRNGSSHHVEVTVRNHEPADVATRSDVATAAESSGPPQSLSHDGAGEDGSSRQVESGDRDDRQPEAAIEAESSVASQSLDGKGAARDGSSPKVEADGQNNSQAEVNTESSEAATSTRKPRSPRKPRKREPEAVVKELLSVPDTELIDALSDAELVS